MRQKILKRIKLAYLIELVAIVVAIICIFILRSKINRGILLIIFGIMALETVIFTFVVKNYERNADKNLINKMVYEGKMALAQIKSGVFDQIVNQSEKYHNVLWKLDVIIYDKNLEAKNVTVYDLFAQEQESIPHGYCYITYDEANPDCLFIVPNMLVGAFESNKELVEMYQKKVKGIKYLNVYYRNGLVMETFAESLKKGEAEKTAS